MRFDVSASTIVTGMIVRRLLKQTEMRPRHRILMQKNMHIRMESNNVECGNTKCVLFDI